MYIFTFSTADFFPPWAAQIDLESASVQSIDLQLPVAYKFPNYITDITASKAIPLFSISMLIVAKITNKQSSLQPMKKGL